MVNIVLIVTLFIVVVVVSVVSVNYYVMGGTYQLVFQILISFFLALNTTYANSLSLYSETTVTQLYYHLHFSPRARGFSLNIGSKVVHVIFEHVSKLRYSSFLNITLEDRVLVILNDRSLACLLTHSFIIDKTSLCCQ